MKAGEVILLTIYKNANQDIGDLNSLRAAYYEGKMHKAATLIKAQTLPPTSDAAALHSLRCYLQIQIWQGNDSLNPLEYGFCIKSGYMVPITMNAYAAPDFLLDNIHCGCRGDCVSRGASKVSRKVWQKVYFWKK